MSEYNLFGESIPDPFIVAKERYGIWPTTVWPCDLRDKSTQELKTLIGDSGQERAGVFTQEAELSRSAYNISASVFNPAVAAWILNFFAPTSGVCLDPFAGGGTRAIMAAKHGLRYVGTELRENEVRAVNERCERAGVADSVEIICGDARFLASYIGKGVGDFLLTCPPYYDLEVYGAGASDLSCAPTYTDFLRGIKEVVAATYSALKSDALSVWVVGLIRNKAGDILPLNHDIARIHREGGFGLREEIILYQQNNGAMQRVGNFDRGSHKLIRVHEYALVFQKSYLY
jgi:DNA modification methylase